VAVMIGTQSLALRRQRCTEEQQFAQVSSVTGARKMLNGRGWTYALVSEQDFCPKHSR
jgi:hypothetical protein